MLLIEVEIQGVTHRISDEYLHYNYFWDAKVASFSNVKVTTADMYGGLVSSSFGDISFTPDLFPDTGLPPESMPIKIMVGNDNDTETKTLFEGTAHIKKMSRTEILYSLYVVDKPINQTIAFSDTLTNVFTTAATDMGLTFVNHSTRSDSLNVAYTSSSEENLVDALDRVTQFYTHFFWLTGTELHLADMLVSYMDVNYIDEFDYIMSTYESNKPVSLFKSDDFTIDGDYAYGSEVSISSGTTVEADAHAALEDCKLIYGRPRTRITMPIVYSHIPIIGNKIDISDKSGYVVLLTEFFVRSISYNFNTWEFTMEGDSNILYLGPK